MPRYPYTDWTAEQFRLTAFLLPDATEPPLETWWRAISGGAPDEITSNARAGVKQLSGPFGGQKLILKLEPGRVDWLFVPQGPDQALPQAATAFVGEVPSIGPITETQESFSRLAEVWLVRDDVPEIVRLAFGEVVWHPEESRRAAYSRIPDYIPLPIDPDATDFNFQINLPADSRTGVESLRINRLSRWGVMGVTRLAFRLDGTTVTTMAPQTVAHVFRMELDINTAPEFRGPLPRGRLVDIYHEFVSSGRAIVTEGLGR